jgi:hypothetical protein
MDDGGRTVRQGSGTEARSGRGGIELGIEPFDLRFEGGNFLGESPGALGNGVSFFL